MIAYICVLAILISIIMAHIRQEYLNSSSKKAELIVNFTTAIRKNRYSEMKPVYHLFYEIYTAQFDVENEITSNAEMIDFIKLNFHKNNELDGYLELLKQYCFAYGAEIDEVDKKLLDAANKYQNIEYKKYKQGGKSSYYIYPSITAMIILILI